MAKAAKSADQINKNWVAGMAGAAGKYTAGVQAVTENPAAKAATPEAMQRYQDGVAQSVSSGRRAASLNAVTLEAWKQAATTKGAQRLPSGASAGAQKQLAAMQKWAPIYAQASQAAAAVPKGDMLGRLRANLNVLLAAAGKPTV